ncbi:MAG: serine acetyltransferase [Deltaproteobacteria bacterium]|nr:serine acetyltransferase [Deltaproteobacteria bacterium]
MKAKARDKKMVTGVQGSRKSLTSLVDTLCSNGNGIACAMRKTPHDQPLPSRDVVVELVEALRSVLFPGYFGFPDLRVESVPYHVGSTLDRIQHTLEEQIKRGLCFSCLGDMDCLPACDRRARSITRKFLSRLPDVQKLLITDVRAAFEGDPAASSPDEVIFCYPGLHAITNYRLAHELHKLGVPLIPRMITEHAHSITGVDIHPGAVIGENFFIDHGTGVVIGETCVIGKGVSLYQGVTLGAKSFKLDEKGNPIKGIPRHPIVEDDVIIYSGATILGRVTIGRGSVIGGNVWLVRSVPPFSRITQAQASEEDYESGSGI